MDTPLKKQTKTQPLTSAETPNLSDHPHSEEAGATSPLTKSLGEKRIVAIAGNRGGTGKTTTAVSLYEWYLVNGINLFSYDYESDNKESSCFAHFVKHAERYAIQSHVDSIGINLVDLANKIGAGRPVTIHLTIVDPPPTGLPHEFQYFSDAPLKITQIDRGLNEVSAIDLTRLR